MKILFIGGTGLISSACSQLIVDRGLDLILLNRNQSKILHSMDAIQLLQGDIHGEESILERLLRGQQFDVVVDWIAYTPEDIERDIRLFSGKTRQFIFISSASAYQKPPSHYKITEDTPLENPFWEYSRNKIACEDRLIREYRQRGFPITIVRPSLTYGPSQIPLCVGSWMHPYTIIDRMKRGQKIIVPGDGTSLWVLTWNADFAKGFFGLLGCRQAIGEAYHITSDEVLTWNQIYLEVGRALGLEPKIVHVPADLISAYDLHAVGSLIGDKCNSTVFDNSKIKTLVPDFTCTVPWADGVRRSIAWHEADPARCTIDHEANRRWDVILDAYGRAFPS